MNDDALTAYMADATGRLVKKVMKDIIKSPKTAEFLVRFRAASNKASEKRAEYQKKGIHVPGFLICSITTRCNLRCKGCYAVSNGICGSTECTEMTDAEWGSLFDQAEKMGISFIILAGGEPIMRKEVMDIASMHRDMVFPVFTNGTMVPENIGFFCENRNMIPVLSIDGPEDLTDERRGVGIFRKVSEAMRMLSEKGVLHAASVTVTSENLSEVTADGFIDALHDMGAYVIFFIEFVPSKDTMQLALGDSGREVLAQRMEELRRNRSDTVFMSFPGDEKFFGGCIGAGRGFMHINPFGDVEACPASPVSDINLKEHTLSDAIASPLFARIRSSDVISLPHQGGCALSEHADEVIRLI